MPHGYGGLRPAVLTYVTALAVLVFGLALRVVHGAQPTLTPREIDEAVQIGQSRIQADRVRFHQPYRVVANQAPVDFVEVITPFRRVVLAAEGRAQIGDLSFGPKKALEMATATEGRFDFNVELTFHPLNTFVVMPQYDVALLRGTARVPAVLVDRQPRYGARVEGLPPPVPTQTGPILRGGSQPLLGGTLIAQFAGDTLDLAGTMDLVVLESGKELSRVRINLGRLR